MIKNFFHFTFITNTGAAFGILKNQQLALIFFSIFVIGVICYYNEEILKKTSDSVLVAALLGGTLGNLIDRIAYGFVIDFLDFQFWPAFNMADSAITISVIGLIYFHLKE